MDTELDHALAAADPAANGSTADLRDALHQLIDVTESASRARPRRLARTAVAATALVALGGAGAAAATGVFGWDAAGWWNDPAATTRQLTNDVGKACRMTFAPRALHVEDHPVHLKDRAEAMEAAEEFLRTFDHATVDGLAPDVIFRELNARLTAALSEQGLSAYAVSVAVANDCEVGTTR